MDVLPRQGDVSDAELLAQSTADPDLFEGFFRRHVEAIYAYVVRRVGSEQSAEALTAEVFLIAFERRGEYRPERETGRPWLYGIAANVLRSHWRDEGRHVPVGPESPVVPATDTVVEDRVDAQQRWPAVARALGRLTSREVEPLLLYAWDGLSYEEIAVALAVPVGTVRSRISRAREALRKELVS